MGAKGTTTRHITRSGPRIGESMGRPSRHDLRVNQSPPADLTPARFEAFTSSPSPSMGRGNL